MISCGIDIGGTFVKILATSEEGKVLRNQKIKTPYHLSSSKFLDFLADIINNFKKELKTKNIVIGVGVAGDTDNKKGILRFAPNIPWPNLRIAEGLTKRTNCNCFVSNDANMAAFGVYKKELKEKYKNILVFTLGTGIGGGIIIEGKLYQGSTGTAGEFGHIKIGDAKTGNLCGCGARGCLESFIGTNTLKKLTVQEVKKNPKSILAQLVKEEGFSVKLLSDAASKKDKFALSLWDYFGTYLGYAVTDLILIFNPEVVVFSGGVAGGAKYFMPALLKILKTQKIKEPFRNIKLLVSKTKDVGALGAALYALSVNNEK